MSEHLKERYWEWREAAQASGMAPRGETTSAGPLGDLLRRERAARRMTQAQAAAQLELSPAALSRFESGAQRVPDLLEAERMARWLGLALVALAPIVYVGKAHNTSPQR